jgi:hypothetical protein
MTKQKPDAVGEDSSTKPNTVTITLEPAVYAKAKAWQNMTIVRYPSGSCFTSRAARWLSGYWRILLQPKLTLISVTLVE